VNKKKIDSKSRIVLCLWSLEAIDHVLNFFSLLSLLKGSQTPLTIGRHQSPCKKYSAGKPQNMNCQNRIRAISTVSREQVPGYNKAQIYQSFTLPMKLNHEDLD
jgi:hypothetical protein